jgi:uncharacterized GH25 family protein
LDIQKNLEEEEYIMKNSYLTKVSLFAVLCLQPLSAHMVWFQEAENGYELAFGENVNETDPLPFAKIDYIKGYTNNKYADKLYFSKEQVGDKPNAGTVTAKPFDSYNVLTAQMTNGYFVKVSDASAPKGYTYKKGAIRDEINVSGQEVLKDLYSVKYAKHIIDWNSYLCSPIGQRLEIIPLSDVTKLNEGDTFKVKIFYEGKPVPSDGSFLAKSSNPTAEDNKAQPLESGCNTHTVTVGPAGLQTVIAKYKKNLGGIRSLSLVTVLSFYTQ